MDRISNAEAALATLEEVVPRASNSVIERDSAILRLVYTFAVVRKACQNLLAQSEGIEASPGRVIGTARRLGWLSDEDAEAAAAAGRDRALAFQTYRVGVGGERHVTRL
jgi:hypothetical protein